MFLLFLLLSVTAESVAFAASLAFLACMVASTVTICVSMAASMITICVFMDAFVFLCFLLFFHRLFLWLFLLLLLLLLRLFFTYCV